MPTAPSSVIRQKAAADRLGAPEPASSVYAWPVISVALMWSIIVVMIVTAEGVGAVEWTNVLGAG